MTAVIAVVLGGAVVASLPYWLPRVVIRLRMFLFTRVNGDEGVPLPSEEFDVNDFRALYGHPAARGRSQGAALSDLFWYWLSPGPEMHQEHIEDGPRYDRISRLTHRILAVPESRIDELAATYTRRHLDPLKKHRASVARLRDAVMPLWVDFYYRIVFDKECSPEVRKLIVDHARNLADALKCTDLRRMKRRLRVTRHIRDELERRVLPHDFPDGFSLEEQAFYLQGAFFTTGVVQSSDGTAHLLLAIAQHPELQARLRRAPDDVALWDGVLHETLRRYPLFGISHRITTADIEWAPGRVMPRGQVLCFNHPKYHSSGYDTPEAFRPERWERLDPGAANFIPFGMPANRPCPAQRVASRSLKKVAQVVLRDFELASSVTHDRSLASRGPCVLLPRRGRKPGRATLVMLLTWLRIRDRWEAVFRSVAQLVLGTFMVWDARRLRMCERYFERAAADRSATGSPPTCPFHSGRDERDPSVVARMKG